MQGDCAARLNQPDGYSLKLAVPDRGLKDGGKFLAGEISCQASGGQHRGEGQEGKWKLHAGGLGREWILARGSTACAVPEASAQLVDSSLLRPEVQEVAGGDCSRADHHCAAEDKGE